jgi:hypothetical protein
MSQFIGISTDLCTAFFFQTGSERLYIIINDRGLDENQQLVSLTIVGRDLK